MIQTTINFKLRGKPKSWALVHNLDEYNLSIDAAFINYTFRTNHPDIEDFCEYVISKDPNFTCITEQQYLNLK